MTNVLFTWAPAGAGGFPGMTFAFVHALALGGIAVAVWDLWLAFRRGGAYNNP